MVDYISAIKRPFQDIKKLLIGVIIMIIPIANFIGTGYILKSVKGYSKVKFKLPEWKDWGDNFITGLKAAIITLVYAIPLLILLLILAVSGGLSLVMAISTASITGFLSALKGAGILVVITILYGLFVAYFTPAAALHFINKGKFNAAFRFKEIGKKAFTGTYLGAWIVSMAYSLILVLALKLVHSFLPAIAEFIVACTQYTLLGEAYQKAK